MSKLSSHRSGIPLGGSQKKKIVMRGVGNPKREWTPGPLIVVHPVREAERNSSRESAELAMAGLV